MQNEFDAKARDWDKNPIHAERSEAIAKAMLQRLPVNPRMKVLEYGAGTGLLSFLLKDRFAEITLMDNSAEMIRIIREKIISENAAHMKPVLINLEKEEFAGSFDMIYSQMVFHHVDNLHALLFKLSRMLNAGSYLAIADLYTEDGSFHGEGFRGHPGFDPEWLAGQIREAGLVNIHHQWCYTITKKDPSDILKEFPVFLITTEKSI